MFCGGDANSSLLSLTPTESEGEQQCQRRFVVYVVAEHSGKNFYGHSNLEIALV